MTPDKIRNVAVFTANRAEYGFIQPVLQAIEAHSGLDYSLIVSGAHLKEDLGRTSSEIEADGFRIHSQVHIDMEADTLFATASAIGSGVLGISRILCGIDTILSIDPSLWRFPVT